MEEYITEEDEYIEYFDSKGNYIGGVKGLDEFRFIKEDIAHIDLDKSYITYKVVIQRISDNKYFEGEYTESRYWDFYERFELTYKEVKVVNEHKVLIFGYE